MGSVDRNGRRLSAEEAALWARVMAGVRPIVPRPAATPPEPARTQPKPIGSSAVEIPIPSPPAARLRLKRTNVAVPVRPPQNTLDGTWDRQLSRGLVSPDRAVDLHGHTLSSAHAMLDAALEGAIRSGDRVILLVTGKPPRPDSERPHARGAIRAAVGDWLAGSRHASEIAAVRPAHPRHGGAGALYIVLRKARLPQKS